MRNKYIIGGTILFIIIIAVVLIIIFVPKEHMIPEICSNKLEFTKFLEGKWEFIFMLEKVQPIYSCTFTKINDDVLMIKGGTNNFINMTVTIVDNKCGMKINSLSPFTGKEINAFYKVSKTPEGNLLHTIEIEGRKDYFQRKA